MSEFNLIVEPWIPVRFPDGRREELGIRDTLLRSKEIAVIEDPSPLVVASLHRLLLAVLYRALEGPTDIDEAKHLFRDGVPEEKVTRYLDKWQDRFWLFDEVYPFGQNVNAKDSKFEPWTKLTAEFNDTSRKVLFDHTDTRNPGTCSLASCCRWLVSTMSFSVSGGSGYRMSPDPNAMYCIPVGVSLHETLILNLVAYPNHAVATGDSALWERDSEVMPVTVPTRPAHGYADLYSWQARMILLDRGSDGEVAMMHFAAGVGCDRSPALLDPMLVYRQDKQNGLMAVGLKPGRDTWRDFASLFPDPSGEGSRTISNVWKLKGRSESGLNCSILVAAQRNVPPNATVEYWRIQQFMLPPELQGGRSLRREFESLLGMADEADRALRESCHTFARDSLSHGDRKVDKKDIQGFIEQTGVGAFFWSALEPKFHSLLHAYVAGEGREAIEHQWVTDLRDALTAAWSELQHSVSRGNIWAIRAVTKARGPVMRKLSELSTRINDLKPSEVQHE